MKKSDFYRKVTQYVTKEIVVLECVFNKCIIDDIRAMLFCIVAVEAN